MKTDENSIGKFIGSSEVVFSDKKNKLSLLKKRKVDKIMDDFVKEWGD